MDISSVSNIHQMMVNQIQSQQKIGTQQVTETEQNFGDFFIKQINETNQLQNQADQELQSLMIGESDNLHDVMVAMEEAKIALEMTTQVRNKIVDAYQEIKNIQI